MRITHMTIEGAPGNGEVDIRATERGADVTGNEVTAHVDRNGDRDLRWIVASNAACVLYGKDGKNRPLCTNSEINDVLNDIERVAGC